MQRASSTRPTPLPAEGRRSAAPLPPDSVELGVRTTSGEEGSGERGSPVRRRARGYVALAPPTS
nr:MAG: hypothetical protein DIU78_17055 [Pseudomonadota bacterium]